MHLLPMIVAGVFALLCIMGVIYVKVATRDQMQEKDEGIILQPNTIMGA